MRIPQLASTVREFSVNKSRVTIGVVCASCMAALGALWLNSGATFGTAAFAQEGPAAAARPRGKDRKLTQIRAAEIGKTVEVVGLLGRPIGKVMRVEGEWLVLDEPMAKERLVYFRAKMVDGIALTEPVLFEHRLMEPVQIEGPVSRPTEDEIKSGDKCRLEGYEMGRFEGVPGEVYDVLQKKKKTKKIPPVPQSPFVVRYRFVTALRYFRFEAIK